MSELKINYVYEKAAIDKAYDKQIGSLFSVLVAGMTGADESRAVERFIDGVMLTRRAYNLAMDELLKMGKSDERTDKPQGA